MRRATPWLVLFILAITASVLALLNFEPAAVAAQQVVSPGLLSPRHAYLSEQCSACHADVHEGQFKTGPFAGQECTACHDPLRFEPAAVEARHRFAYLPFSAGPRYCIGATFAMAEMTMHLAMVADRFRLEYTGAVPPAAEFQVNLRSRHDLHMRLVAR